MVTKKIGLLLSDEDDWPVAFEQLHHRLSPRLSYHGDTLTTVVERIRIHPFSLRAGTSYHLVIDRLAWWHFHPREWLKKAALINGVYLLNNPFTFQSMEKHSAYCAMIRLGFPIPETWLIPTKIGPDTEKFRRTAARYHDLFDLPAIARQIGYPLYMKPFDGGGWRGVSRIGNEWELMAAYDASGQTMMHLQQGLENYDVFTRALAIGPQVKLFHYDPTQPMHARYLVDENFLPPDKAREATATVKIINAFFRWEFNSCESILKNGVLHPIDFANACPDVAIISLHYYFPWAIKSLMAWSLFCLATDRRMQLDMNTRDYFAIADSDRSFEEKLAAYEALADRYFETERFFEWRARELPHLDEAMWELAQSPEFDDMLVHNVRLIFPPHEHAYFIEHFRGLIRAWVQAEAAD
ncbi:MAG: hypothetical protein NZ528_11860 [Caldilineales bacterium]|nr:hypothetical protein [Caldilineales bacterium]MDW8319063.1 hypothetical protein [Anaerolineae bacterium]